MNPFCNLISHNKEKDINESFFNTLEAILHFNAEGSALQINSKTDIEIKSNICQDDALTDFFLKLKEDKKLTHINTFRNQADYKIVQPVHIGEFLILKLIEKFRRLYSAHRNAGKIHYSNKESIIDLKKQQDYIYNCLSLIKDLISFDQEDHFFNGSFFGQGKICKSADVFFFLSFHENLTKENEDIHTQLFNYFFSYEKINFNFLIDELMKISYPKDKIPFVKKIISNFPSEFFNLVEVKITDNKLKVSSFSVDLFFYFVEHNIQINTKQKILFLNKVLLNRGFVNIKNPDDIFVEKLKLYVSDIPKNELNTILLSMMDFSIKDRHSVNKICVELMDNIQSEQVFISVNSNSNMPIEYKNAILSKFNLTDQQFIFNIAKKINNLSPMQSVSLFKTLFMLVDGKIENNTISNILALNYNLIKDLQPIILKQKLQIDLVISDNYVTKKIKI